MAVPTPREVFFAKENVPGARGERFVDSRLNGGTSRSRISEYLRNLNQGPI